jgi:hypothetical protein
MSPEARARNEAIRDRRRRERAIEAERAARLDPARALLRAGVAVAPVGAAPDAPVPIGGLPEEDYRGSDASTVPYEEGLDLELEEPPRRRRRRRGPSREYGLPPLHPGPPSAVAFGVPPAGPPSASAVVGPRRARQFRELRDASPARAGPRRSSRAPAPRIRSEEFGGLPRSKGQGFKLDSSSDEEDWVGSGGYITSSDGAYVY